MSESVSTLGPAVIAAEQRAREYLAQNQWRKAREELKPLTKMDRPRFLPLLIKANIGLSREMMAKGQVSEAQQVLSYLAGIATTEQLRAAEQELSGPAAPSTGNLEKVAREFAEAAPDEKEEVKLRRADQLVLAFRPGQEPAGIEPRILAELKAVHEGLMAASLQQWDRLGDMLRIIPHRSAFAHWTGFIKGVAAFHAGDLERTQRFLGSLPEKSVPAKAAQAYLLWPSPASAPANGVSTPRIALEGACRLLGHPGAGEFLSKAEELWKNRRSKESYRALRDGMPCFPSLNQDWTGTLTEFYFNAPHTFSESDRETYVMYFDGLLASGATKNGVEEMLALRMFALGHGERQDWEGYLRLRERLRGPNPQLSSIVYTEIGRDFARVPDGDGFFGRQREPVDGGAGVNCFRKAITLDPNNLQAHLGLVDLYKTLGRLSERNRLLDQMVERFPDETRVLVDAAIGCIEREAYVKALGYLEQAQSLDQLDPRIPEQIVVVRRRLARQYFEQNRPDKARASLAAAEQVLTDKPEDLRRSRWTFRLDHGLMEQCWGDSERGTKLLEEARASCPSAAAFFLFAHFQHCAEKYDFALSDWWEKFNAALRSGVAVGELTLLIQIVDHWEIDDIDLELTQADDELRKQVKGASRRPFTRAEACQLMELRSEHREWRKDLLRVVKKALSSDRLDPRFRFYEHFLNRTPFSPRHKKELSEILHEAARRGDESVAQRIRHVLKRLESPPPPLPLPDDDDDWNDAPDFDDVEAFGPDPSQTGRGLDDFLKTLPPGVAANLEMLREMFRSLPDSEIAKARRTRPEGMPAELFDLLVEASRNERRDPGR